MNRTKSIALIAATTGAVLVLAAASAGWTRAQTRTFPDTTNGVFVFNDQLDTSSMSEAQYQFAASHYVGCQKISRDASGRIRTYNPNFLVLH